MPRKRGPGGPWVIVRAQYGALPSMAGRDWSERAKAFGIMAQASPRAGSTVPGTKKSPRRDAERRCRVPLFLGNPGNKPRPLPRCAFRRSASLFSLRGRFTEPTIYAKIFAGGDDARLPRRSNPLTAERANATLWPTRKNAAAVRKP